MLRAIFVLSTACVVVDNFPPPQVNKSDFLFTRPASKSPICSVLRTWRPADTCSLNGAFEEQEPTEAVDNTSSEVKKLVDSSEEVKKPADNSEEVKKPADNSEEVKKPAELMETDEGKKSPIDEAESLAERSVASEEEAESISSGWSVDAMSSGIISSFLTAVGGFLTAKVTGKM